jgi:hypothetical protein
MGSVQSKAMTRRTERRSGCKNNLLPACKLRQGFSTEQNPILCHLGKHGETQARTPQRRVFDLPSIRKEGAPTGRPIGGS